MTPFLRQAALGKSLSHFLALRPRGGGQGWGGWREICCARHAHDRPARPALGALAQNDLARFHAILGPTVPLSRHIFAAPTRFYKTGVVCMAWLNGHQSHFTMVGGQQSTRSLVHLAELFRLADAANLLEQPELAVHRMQTLLALHGVEG